MKAVSFKEANDTLRAPLGMVDVEDLPIHRSYYPTGEPCVISCWRMSWIERLTILLTGRLWFHAMGQTHPPITFATDNPFVRRIWSPISARTAT